MVREPARFGVTEEGGSEYLSSVRSVKDLGRAFTEAEFAALINVSKKTLQADRSRDRPTWPATRVGRSIRYFEALVMKRLRELQTGGR